jgi:CHRD domain-containing protein/exosortase sorting signal-containing protein
MKILGVLAVAAVASIAGAGTAGASFYSGSNLQLNGANEVPANASTATGVAFVQINTVSKTVEYSIYYSGLSPNAAHFHAPAPVGQNASVVLPIAIGPSPLKATLPYPAAFPDFENAVLHDSCYINLHTAAFPGGEIRAQVHVAQTSAVVPSLSQWGMFLLALSLAGVGGAYALRRRRAIA